MVGTYIRINIDRVPRLALGDDYSVRYNDGQYSSMGAAYWDGGVAGIFYRTNRGSTNSIVIVGFRAIW